MNLEGRVVLITGASSGIGAATARLAHSRGAQVVMAARRADRLAQLAEELPGALAVAADVTVASDRVSLVQRCLEAKGCIDVLVNNAGQGLHVPLMDVDAAAYRDIIELNVVAPLVLMQLVVPHMREQGGGAIVNVSSRTSRMTLPGVGAYASTKAALNLLSETARAELAGDGVTVSLVLPSVTESEFHRVLRQGLRREGELPFAAQPAEEVAEAILDLIVTGEPEAVLSHRR